MIRLNRTSRIALAVALAAPATVAAQGPPAADSINPVVLDSLRVDVLRTPMELGSVPFSISVVGQDEIFGAKGLVSLEEVLSGVPGLQVQDRYNDAVGERISLRGFGSRAQFGVRGIKILVDDIPATLADGQSTLDHLELGSLGRVEVLRGPNSMLYGGAAGGVIRFSTQAPPVSGLLQTTRATYGTHGYWRLNSTTSGVAGQNGYLLGLGLARRDGFRTNPLDEGGDPYGASDRLQLNGRLVRPLGPGRLEISANLLDLDAENPGSLSDSLLALGDRQAYRFNVIQKTRKQITQAQAGARFETPAAGGSLEVGAYAVSRSLDNPIPSDVIDLSRTAGGVRALYRRSIDLDVGSTPATLTFVVGSELDLQDDDRTEYENDGGNRGALLLQQDERVRAAGTFASLLYQPTNRLTAAAGLRYDRVGFSADDRLVAPGEADDSGSRALDAVSPSLGVHAQVHEGLGLFANLSSSFQTPTTTELANRVDGAGGFNPDLDPASSINLEAGARGKVGSAAAWEVTAFRTRVDQELVPFEVASAPGRTYFRNAGKSTYAGAELALLARPTQTWMLRGAYSYLRARFDEYIVDTEDYAGNRVPGQAPHRVDATLRWIAPWGHIESHVVGVSAIPVDDAGAFESPSYNVVDLRILARDLPAGLAGMRVAPFAAINNVFDTRYNSSVIVNAFGRRYFEPAPGRRLQLGASATWARP